MTGLTFPSHSTAEGGKPMESFPSQAARDDMSTGAPGSRGPKTFVPAGARDGRNGLRAASVIVGTTGTGTMGRAAGTAIPAPTVGRGAIVGSTEGSPVPVAFNSEFRIRVFSSMSDVTRSTLASTRSGIFFSTTTSTFFSTGTFTG